MRKVANALPVPLNPCAHVRKLVGMDGIDEKHIAVRAEYYETPVSFTVEETPIFHRAWLRLHLSTPPGEVTGLDSGVTLNLICHSQEPEAVKAIAKFLGENIATLRVDRKTRVERGQTPGLAIVWRNGERRE